VPIESCRRSVFMLFAMLMYWHDLGWYDIGAMLLYLANFDGAQPWMGLHLWSLCVEEHFYFAGLAYCESGTGTGLRSSGSHRACSSRERWLLVFQSSKWRLWNISRGR
jgi:hypothetical protein